MEGEGEAFFRRGRRELLEPDGFLPDPVPEPGGEDFVGRQSEGPVDDEVRVLVLKFFDAFLPALLDLLRPVDDVDGVLEIIRERDKMVLGKKSEGGEAGIEFPPVERGDLDVQVPDGPFAALAGRRLPSVQESGAGREFPEPGDGQPLEFLERPLARDVEFPERGDFGAGEFDPEGVGFPRGVDVDDPAPPGVFAG